MEAMNTHATGTMMVTEVYNDPDLLRQKSDELSDLRFHQEELFAAWEAAMEEQESYEQSQQTEE